MRYDNPKGIFMNDDGFGMEKVKNRCPRCNTTSTTAMNVENVFMHILGKKYKCEKVNCVCIDCQLLFDYLRYGVIVE